MKGKEVNGEWVCDCDPTCDTCERRFRCLDAGPPLPRAALQGIARGRKTLPSSKPTVAGLYQVRCMENGGEWEHVAISRRGPHLMVHDPLLGVYDLDAYHNGLTDLEWKFIA